VKQFSAFRWPRRQGPSPQPGSGQSGEGESPMVTLLVAVGALILAVIGAAILNGSDERVLEKIPLSVF
jgi:hypothetical protein